MKNATSSEERVARTRRMNELRREAVKLWELRSPFRQSVYIKSRLKGKTPEDAIQEARRKP